MSIVQEIIRELILKDGRLGPEDEAQLCVRMNHETFHRAMQDEYSYYIKTDFSRGAYLIRGFPLEITEAVQGYEIVGIPDYLGKRLRHRPEPKLFDGIPECRLGACYQISTPEALSIPSGRLPEIINRGLVRGIHDALLQSNKIQPTKYIKPRTMQHDTQEEYRAELYVFTPDELNKFVDNVRQDARN